MAKDTYEDPADPFLPMTAHGQAETPDVGRATLRLAAASDAPGRAVRPEGLGQLAVRNIGDAERLVASPWTVGMVLRRPLDAPPLLPSASSMIANLFEGRDPITALGRDKVVLAVRVEDDGPRSRALGWLAAECTASLLGYPRSSIESVRLIHDDHLTSIEQG